MNHKTIEKMEAALNAGKHVNIDPDGSITVSDTKPHPTIDQLDATIGSEEHNRANLHPTPEEMAKLLIGFCFDHSVFTYKKHCEKCSIKAITEAIQSAQRQSQQRIEELEGVLQSVEAQCEYLTDKPPNMQALTIQVIYAGVCQALNPKSAALKGTEESP